MVYDYQHEILGEYANHGYYIQEYEDAVVVCFKDKQIGAYSKAVSCEILQKACQRHEARLREAVGVAS